jgi:hypothetical protein
MNEDKPQRWWKAELREQRTLWILVVITGVVLPLLTAGTAKPGEFYPFSNFPMYKRFEDETYYVYVSDLSDQVLNVGHLFGLPISNAKKIYDSGLDDLKKETRSKEKRAQLPMVYRTQAAENTLALLIKNAPMAQRPHISTLSGLRLHQVNLFYKEGRIQKESQPVGELVLNTAAPR